jgi:hypothetical protein
VLLQPLNVPEWLEGFADDSLRTTSVTAAEALGEFFVKCYLRFSLLFIDISIFRYKLELDTTAATASLTCSTTGTAVSNRSQVKSKFTRSDDVNGMLTATTCKTLYRNTKHLFYTQHNVVLRRAGFEINKVSEIYNFALLTFSSLSLSSLCTCSVASLFVLVSQTASTTCCRQGSC